MEITTRKFKQPKSLEDCEKIECSKCAAMCDILMDGRGECYDMWKALKFRKAIAPREK